MRAAMTTLTTRAWAALCAGLLAYGCGAAEEPPPPPATGTARLAFKLTDSVRTDISPTGMTPIKGTIYGELFLAEDVTAVGPIDEAKPYGSVTVPIDLTSMQVSSGSWTSMEFEPNRYSFLGYLDLGDKSKPENRSPASGDPVTLPFTNRFDIEANKQTEYTVTFDLLFN
jgi:hypothetical protein